MLLALAAGAKPGMLDEQAQGHGAQVLASEANRQALLGGVPLGFECGIDARYQRCAQLLASMGAVRSASHSPIRLTVALGADATSRSGGGMGHLWQRLARPQAWLLR